MIYEEGTSVEQQPGPSQAPQLAPPANAPQEVPFDWSRYQHDQIRNRLAVFTSNRPRDTDTIDAIILYKSDIIGRMAQLDPNPFWAEQRNELIANRILNNGAEYTIETLQKNLEKLTTEGQNSFFFKKLIKERPSN